MTKNNRSAYLLGRVTFDFYGNTDCEYRNKMLAKLAKLMRSKFNISVDLPELNEYEPEFGQLVFASVGKDLKSIREFANKIMDSLEAESSARIIADSWIAEEMD